jgi:hypothetical protein
LQPPDERDIQQAVETARRAIDPDIAGAAWQHGLDMTTDEAIEYALGWLDGLTASTMQLGARLRTHNQTVVS